MQQDYINLINFLKENDESVRKDLEELFYFVSITSFWENNRVNSKIFTFNYWQCKTEDEAIWKSIKKIREDNVNMNNKIWIELYSCYIKELDYHHIMMYCEHKWIDFNISVHWWNSLMIWWDKDLPPFLDHTKPLHEQKNEVYKALLDYFIWLQ